MKEEFLKIKKLFILFVLLLVVGTLGYAYFLDVSYLNALYMTVITISTVGYKEVATMNSEAVVFSIFIIFWGIGVVGYALSSLAVIFVEGHIQKYWKGRIMEKKIQALTNHYIVCGAGELAFEIMKELQKEGEHAVLLDENLDSVQEAIDKGYLALPGHSVKEEDLLEVGILQARGLVTCHDQDVDNIVTVLNARDLSENLNIVSLAHEPVSELKLKKVGANNILSTSKIGGRRLAALLTKPHVISFLDVITRVGDMEFDLEEVILPENSSLHGLTLAEAQIPAKTGLMIFAVKKPDQPMILNPSGSLTLYSQDVLLILGREEPIARLRELVQS